MEDEDSGFVKSCLKMVFDELQEMQQRQASGFLHSTQEDARASH